MTISKKNILLIFSLLKFNSLNKPTIFLELSAFDDTNLQNNIIIYTFLIYFTKIKFFLFCNLDNTILNATCSNLFLNSSWSEREISEMHDITFEDKNDSRHIMLDYSFVGNPMKKNYSIIGYIELSYNFIIAYIEYMGVILQESMKNEIIFDF